MRTEIDLREWEDRNEPVGRCERVVESDIDNLENHCHAESTKTRAKERLERDRKHLETVKAKRDNLEKKMETIKNTEGVVFIIDVGFINYSGYPEGHKEYVFNTFDEAMDFYDKQPKNGYYFYYLEYEPVEDYIKRLEEQKAVYLQEIAELDEEIRKVLKG